MTLSFTPDFVRIRLLDHMKRHVTLVLVRLLLATGVVCALPFAHMKWGETYSGDGQQGFGFIVVFLLIGSAAAAVYLGLGSLAQFLLRRRAVRFTVLVDLGLFALFAGVLVYGGVTARYGDTQPNKARAANSAMTSLFHAGRQWRGVADARRSAVAYQS